MNKKSLKLKTAQLHRPYGLDHGLDPKARTKRRIHIEQETWPNKNTIAIRLAEYGAAAAFDSVKVTEHGAVMTIPYSAVVFLRKIDQWI